MHVGLSKENVLPRSKFDGMPLVLSCHVCTVVIEILGVVCRSHYPAFKSVWLSVSLLRDGACARRVQFPPVERFKPENYISSLALRVCYIFLQAKAVMMPRKQGAQGDLPGSTSWVSPG